MATLQTVKLSTYEWRLHDDECTEVSTCYDAAYRSGLKTNDFAVTDGFW